MKNSALIVALLSGVSMASISTQAQAQAADENEIVVTAQNRAQNVQDVPIAIDVISGEQFAESGVTNFRDLEKLAPALNITNDNQFVQIAMRGIGTNTADESQDTSVVVNVDGEYINRGNVLNMSLFDLERVEVLRGPQGTLQGRNSTAGAINFITRQAGSTFGGNASVSYGNFNELDAELGVDIPLGDIGGIRVFGQHKEHDGYFHNSYFAFGPPVAGPDSGTDDVDSGRISLHLAPNDRLTVNAALEFADRSAVPENQAFVDLNAPGNAPGANCAGGGGGWVRVAPDYPDTLCIPLNTNFLSTIDRKDYVAAMFGPGDVQQSTWAARGRVAYDFGPATVTYTGGVRTTDQSGFLGLPVIFRNYDIKDTTDTQSHELRINGETSGGLVWQAGYFRFEESLDHVTGFFLPDFVVPPTGAYLTYFSRDVHSTSNSVFAQVDIPITQTLAAVAGIRHTSDKRDAVYGSFPFIPATPGEQLDLGALAAAFPQFVQNLNVDEDQTTWLAGLNYHPNADTLIYGKASTGYKAGGFDAIGTYRPETNTAYEIGYKHNFGAGGRNIFNIDAFYYDYQDLQVSVLLDTAVGGQVFNAGKATIWGVEAETDLQLSANDHLSVSVNYLNAEYGELFAQYNVFCVGGCATTGISDLDPNTPGIQFVNLGGNTPPHSPEWTIALGYDHVFHLGNSGTLTASAFTRYKSSFFLDIFNQHDSEQEAYTQSDVSLQYEPPSQRWNIQLFGRNLEDKRPLSFAGYIAAGPDDIYNFQFGQPRTYGVRVGVDF